jgi:DNA-binding SARP family transcriptional activator
MTVTAQGVLEVRLFGSPRLEVAGNELVLPTKRALGVVAYLALEGATTRDKLAQVLWDDLLFDNPKRNLRQELYRLSKTPIANFLEFGDMVHLHCHCDAKQAKEMVIPVKGEFLPKFEVPEAPQFAVWLRMQREHFARLRLTQLEARAKTLTGVAALDCWLEILRLDGFRETAMQQILRLEVQHIGLSMARERYTDFKKELRTELGLEPLPETQALARELGLDSQVAVQTPTDVRQTRVLMAAALLEQPFEAPMLFEVTGLPDFEVLECLEKATNSGLLRRSELGFLLLEPEKHLVGLSALNRKTLERQLAKRLQALAVAPDIIARHLEQAGETSLAGAKYLEAAELANRQHQIEASLEFYNKVLLLSPSPEQKFMVLQARIGLARRLDNRIWREAVRDLEHEARNRGYTERMTADLQRALWHFAKAEFDKTLEFITPHLEQEGKSGALAAYMQGLVMVKTGQLEGAQTYLERALQTKNALEDMQTAEVHNVLCFLAVQRNQLALAKTHNQICLKGFARSGHQVGLIRALSTAGVIEMLGGQHRAAVRMFKRSFEVSQKIGDVAGQIAILLNLSHSTIKTCQYDLAHAYLEQGLKLLEQHPNEEFYGSYLVNIASIERNQMKLNTAWTRVVTALEMGQSQQAMPKVARRALMLVSMAIERSQVQLAYKYLELAQTHCTPELEIELTSQKAHLALLQEQPEQTIAYLKDQEATRDDLEYRSGLMAFAYLQLGQFEKAKAVLEISTSSDYAPYVQAARIKTHAALGTLEPIHFEPPPSKHALPFANLALYQAFAQHHPEKHRFTKEAAKLEKILQESPFDKPK